MFTKKIEPMKKYFLLLVFSLTLFISCKSVLVLEEQRGDFTRIDSNLNSEKPTSIDSIIAPYKTELDSKMNEVIGYCDGLNKGKPESTLGNWVADAISVEAKKYGKVDFSAQNYGGLRIGNIPEGEITIGKMFELMPFENFLVIVQVDGLVARQFFDKMASNNGWPISSEVKYEIIDGKAHNILINGEPLEDKKTYNIALSDYIANGGDRCDFFAGKNRINTSILIRDLLINRVKKLTTKSQKVSSKKDGRVL